ncbi:glycosyltransferase family 4 protein [Allopontixanthobacter sp.]|uniref:glycosyltransferase family 4 protein n=1 Tax=Allopontixanthobacter sp. TaxID=2906452 RepID=UPI002ABB6681|nr:glycosyltransferase family 4 protein [Allopontixanthobacter sp.]MDZ4306937.1 glycosyltransferase family 4 protein [Allopontixanthobacter sp.]
MRIAQVAPLAESCPPKLYGGTERIVHFLTEELVRQGHHVTLFASGDSTTRAELVPCVQQALRLIDGAINLVPHHLAMVEGIRRRLDEFDIVHFHIDLVHYPAVIHWNTPTLTTLHGRLDIPDIFGCYRAFSQVPLVSISDYQRKPLPPVNWVDTVYHGLPPQLLPFNPASGDYLVFLGRISPEKRPDRAIEIAVKAGMPLKIAAKIDKVDEAYWNDQIRPMVDAHGCVEYIGEIDERQKSDLLGNAAALLFPIDWPEPFGLVMIEAMSCGTPVIAWKNGSVPEVVEDGVSGRIVGSMDEAIAAVSEVLAFDRAKVRSRFDARFTVGRMAKDYLRIYDQLIAETEELRRG